MSVTALAVAALAACPGPRGPSIAPPPSLTARTLELGKNGAELTGIAGDGSTVFVALTGPAGAPVADAGDAATPAAGPTDAAAGAASAGAVAAGSAGAPPAGSAGAPITAIEAFSPGAFAADSPAWRTELTGIGGQLAVSSGRVIVALTGSGNIARSPSANATAATAGAGPAGAAAAAGVAPPGAAGITLRGEPGAALVALDAATGAPTWALAIDSTEWSVIAALAAAPDGVIVGGSFSGTLRIDRAIVSSAGRADGFVARITAAGRVAWLIRVGGPGADAVQGVAATADRIAVAGTFAAGADVLGRPLSPVDDRSPFGDGFVAELDPAGALRWADSFGGPADDTVAGVAIDARGRIAVAATARDTIHIGDVELAARGPADGVVAWWTSGGRHGPAVLVGGNDFDGLRAIAAAGERIVVGGFYSGTIRLGSQTFVAGGGDDAFLAAFDPAGQLVEAWPVSGEGREEITALSAVPGGFVAGISHTAAATIGRDALPSPPDPLSGAAIVVRPVR